MDRAAAQQLFAQAASLGAQNLGTVDLVNVASLLVLAALPALTLGQYRQYEAYGAPDLTPLAMGLVSRRWLLENLLSLLYVGSLLANAGLGALGWTPSLSAFGLPVWALALYGIAAVRACAN